MRYHVDYPAPVKGETIYSWVARAHLYSGYPSFRRHSLKTIIENDALACTEFPSFISKIAMESGIDESWLIHFMTGVDYYRPFLPIEQYQKLESCLLEGNTSFIHSQFGMIANRLLTSRELKSCPLCIEKDRQDYGFSYWHVIHQLTGVTCCPFHLLRLNTQKSVRSLATSPAASTKKLGSEAEIALSIFILEAFITEKEHLPVMDVIAVIKNRLFEMGMLTQSGSIRYRVFLPYLLNELNLLPNENPFLILRERIANGSFPSSMFYRPYALHHPLKYYFLINCLFRTWENFNEAMYKHPTEIIPLVKPLSSKVFKDDNEIIALLKQGLSLRKVKEQLGSSIVYLKKVAARNQIDVEQRPSKLFSFEKRAIWRKLLVGKSTGDIAKEFEVSQGAIEQVLSKYPDLIEVRKSIRFFKRRCGYRQIVEDYLAAHCECTQKEVRSYLNAAYMWLYKHDRAWFDKTMPKPTPRVIRFKK